jgi:S-adenosylmethionine decarboxylase
MNPSSPRMGTHFIFDMKDGDRQRLNDPALIEKLMLDLAEIGQTQVLHKKIHCFVPHGLTGMLILAESHISVHTWPETGLMGIDFFCCKPIPNSLALSERILVDFPGASLSVSSLLRG